MPSKAILTIFLILFWSPVWADKAEDRALLEVAIEEYEECNRKAAELASELKGRTLGWKAVFAEGSCLNMLQPVNERMLELFIPDVTFYKIQNLRATVLRKNMEQIDAR